MAAVTCGSLALFVAVSEPQGGHAVATSGAWVSAGTAVPPRCWPSSAGVDPRCAGPPSWPRPLLWALVATFIKTTADTIAQFGVGAMFLHWPVYVVAVTGLAGEFLNQATLHVGPLSVSQPLLVVVDPIVSIALSVWIFGEHFTDDALRLALAPAAFTVTCAAVTVLTRTAPSTIEAAAPAAGTVE